MTLTRPNERPADSQPTTIDTRRQRLSLDGQWRFWVDAEAQLSPTTLDPAAARPIQVPAPWQSQAADLRYYSGVGWYQREFELPAEWLGERAVLRFNAADYAAEVWLNETRVGEHEGGYLPFEFDVTEAARPGANRLTVRIADLIDEFAEVPHGKQSWYGPLSGLWQPVWVERRPRVHVLHLRLTPRVDQACVEVEATLSRPAEAPPRLTLEVFDPGGQVCARGEVAGEAGASLLSGVLPVPEPRLWDLDTPNLYTLRATLQVEGVEDSLSDTFGFRTIEARDGRLLLNGRPIYLRGALDQDYYPDLISTPPSLEYIEASFRQAKALGLNCLRIHIKVADPRYYQAADRAGLLVWTELPNWGRLTEAATRRGRETIAGMVQRDWNHPSIVIWTIINEAWGTELYANAEHRAWLAEMHAWLKSLDSTRLVVDNSPCFPNAHVVTDIADFHFYAAIPDHYREWRRWVQAFARHPEWAFAHTYEGYAAWRAFVRAPWRPAQRSPSPEVQRQGSEPLVISEFGNWGLPDIDQLRACHGGEEPWWFETGLEWGEGIAYPHGIEQRYRAYHLDRVFPTLSDLTTASQRLQYLALKYEIEQMRRHASLSGYVVTEFTDVHWEANGLLDICRQPKAFYADFARINADDVIVPDWDRVAYWEGERCQVRLALSHFSNKDLGGSRLVWELEGWPDIAGEQARLRPEPASVLRLRSLRFTVPPVAHGTRAVLRLRLYARDGTLAAANEQELYFFPRRAASPQASVRVYAPELAAQLRGLGYTVAPSLEEAHVAVTPVLNDKLRAYAQSGGRVLWLAQSRYSLRTYLGSVKVLERERRVWQGDWVSNFNWLCQERLFGELPTGGVVDFAFADLIPDHVITGLTPLDFAANVHAGLFVGWIHRPVALVAEQPLGRGRLLISTFKLRQRLRSHPVAAIMLHDMIGHLAA